MSSMSAMSLSASNALAMPADLAMSWHLDPVFQNEGRKF